LRVQRVIAAAFAVLQHEAIAARRANALNDRRRHQQDARLVITGHRLVGLIHDALIGHALGLALGKALEG
jgi:putative lipase involved disintegration of autophagic bodies